jgi:hypothetical protein
MRLKLRLRILRGSCKDLSILLVYCFWMSYVIKADGEKEKFSSSKIKKSILDAGGAKELANETVKKIEREKVDEISTERILDLTLSSLKKNVGVADRYDLKRAIMQLGPTGFPFEKFFAIVLNNYGYDVDVGKVLQGKYVTHEVDIIAKKQKTFMIECKYHNQVGAKTRVKVPLYIYARFLDLKNKFDSPWVATNTKCTSDVKKYAKGMGMKITSWNYPRGTSLRDLITAKKLYPITVIRGIDKQVKKKLFDSDIFLVKTLAESNIDLLRKKTGLSVNVLGKIVEEAKAIIE